MKIEDLDDEFFVKTRKGLFPNEKQKTLEEAFEEALELKPIEKKREHRITDEEWI